jgi:hypothetical protein
MLLAYPDCLVAVVLTLVIIWLAWAVQFFRAYEAVLHVFGGMPGFSGFWSFWLGYAGVASVTVADRQMSVNALWRSCGHRDALVTAPGESNRI